MKIVVINGKGGVGKDEFVKQCGRHVLQCVNISTVDFVKAVAAKCGWDGTKTPENRKFLSDLKDLLTEWDDVPFKKVVQEIEYWTGTEELHDFGENDIIIFIHCREPKEIQRYVDTFGATTLLIRRPAAECVEQFNHADNEVLEYSYDYIINNHGTIQELEQKAIQFLQELGMNNLIF